MAKRGEGKPLKKTRVGIKRMLLPLMVFSIAINVLTLVLPIYMLQIYDRVLTSRNLTTLLLLTVIAFVLLAVGSLLTHYRSRMAARMGNRATERLAPPAFDLLLKSRLDVSAEPEHLVQDLDQIRDFMGGGNMLRLFDIPWTPIFLFVIDLLHPLAGMVASGFAFALLLVDWLGDRRTSGGNRLYQQARLKADQFLQSILQRADEIWSMGMVDGVGAHWHRRRGEALAEQAKVGDGKSTLDAYRRFIQQGAQMGMLGTGAYLAVLEQITAGTIVAGSIICARALSPLAGITRSCRHYRDVRRAFAGFKQAIAERGDPGQRPAMLSQAPALRTDDLAVDSGGDMPPMIRRLDLDLSAGQTLAIVGPSGTGKSQLARTLVGARRPAAGRVRLNGVDLHQLAFDRLGRMIGYVPEKLSLFEGSFGQHIARFGEVSFDALDHAIERAGLIEPFGMLPDGYDTPIEIAARHLSPVQLRFVALARALYGDPPLLVLDQLDDGLDQAGLQTLGQVLTHSRAIGQITVLVTNRASIVQQFDRVLILSKRGVETFCDVNQLPRVAHKAGGG